MVKYVKNGTYGCVMRPNVPCASGISSNERISKVFANNWEAKDELKLNSVVKKIDPESKFTVKLYEECAVKPSKFPKTELDQCGNFKKHHLEQSLLYQIVYENGGTDLWVYKNESFEDLFTRMQPLFEGIVAMDKKGYTHYDIKPDNIVYNPATKKMAFIDFGLAHKTNANYDYSKKPDLATFTSYTYNYYPPEFKLFTFHTQTFKNLSHTCIDARNQLEYFKYIVGYHRFIYLAIVTLGKKFRKHYSDDVVSSFDNCAEFTVGSKRHKHFIEMVDDLEKQGEKYFNTISNKVDVYSLGISLLEIYIHSELNGLTSVKKNTSFYNKFFNLIFTLTDFNPVKRANPEAALSLYKDALETLNKNDLPEYIVNPDTSKRIKTSGPLFKKLLRERGWGFWLETEKDKSLKPVETKKAVIEKAERWLKRKWIEEKVKNPDTGKRVAVTGDVFYKLVVKYGWEFWAAS